jgi:integrase
MLTKSQLDRAQPKGARYVIWDRKLPGFGVRVTPAGKKSFILSYRLKGTRRAITATIGRYGKITLEQAKQKAKQLAATVELDGDPQSARHQRTKAEAEEAPSVDVLVTRYLEALKAGQVSSRRLRGATACQGYIEDTERHLKRLVTTYGKQSAASLASHHIERLLHGYVGRPATQRQMHGAIHRLYRWASRQGLAAVNPAAEIELSVPPARERSLSLQELATIWQAAGDLNPLYRDAVRLAIATGQRIGEVAGMRWGEIDLMAGLWTLPAGRTKARRQHIIPLPGLAVQALKARDGACPQTPAGDDLVLPSRSRDRTTIAPLRSWSRPKRELDRRTQVQDWRLHDFRRSLVTILAEHGEPIAVLDSMLNHAASATRGGIVGVYQRATLLEPMRAAVRRWNRLLQNALDNPQGKVVRLPRRRG